MAIKDVSLQYAAMFAEAAEEEKKYEEACQEACKAAQDAEKKAIDEFDAEEIDPSECGFTEADVECNEVVDPLQMWKDLKKDEKGTALVPVDNNYINTMKKLLARIKSSKKPVYDRVMMKLAEYMKNGTQLPAPEDYAENFIPFEQIARGASPDSEDYSDATGAFGNDVADQNLWDSEEADESDVELDETGCAVKKEEEKKVEEAACQNEEDPAAHLLDPVGVKASTASLAGQDAAAISVVEALVKKLSESNEKIEESSDFMTIEEAKNFIATTIQKSQKPVKFLVMTNNLTDFNVSIDNKILKFTSGKDFKRISAEELIDIIKKAGLRWRDISDIIFDDQKLIRVYQISSKFSHEAIELVFQFEPANTKKYGDFFESEEEKVEEAEEEVSKVSESQYDETQAARKLTYEDQLKFKRWAMRKLGMKGDPFYFDYVTGVDAKTSNDLPGLTADGSMTWGEGVEALKKHFKIEEGVEGGNGKDINDKENLNEEEKVKEIGKKDVKEADESFEDDGESDADKPVEKSDDLKRAEAIQAISFERKLTQAEEDEFRGILAKLDDYEKELLLGNLSKTGFARPGNHTGMRAQDDAGNSVEIPAFNNTEDPEDHSQKKSIMKRQQRAELAQDIQNTQDNALSSIDNNLNVGGDVSQEDWQIALGTMKNKEKKALMNELIADVEAEYAGKDDAESKKAREEEIWFIWQIFGYDPKTRDLGKVWKVSHRGAGKYYNKTMDKMADAFRSVGIRKMSDIEDLTAPKFNKMLDFLKKAAEERKSWKIDPKQKAELSATEAPAEVATSELSSDLSAAQ